jgi:Fur family ferric uptake transcriptional regulator
MEGGRALFELTPVVHRHNLICVRCHKHHSQLDDCPLSQYESDIAKPHGI